MALKLGAENKRNVYIASALGLIVLVMLVRFLMDTFGGSPPPPVQPAVVTTQRPAVTTTSSNSSSGHEAVKLGHAATTLDPSLHPELMAQAESLEYTGNGRNIFSMSSVPAVAIPAPIKTARNEAPPVQTGPPQPPPPPAIDLKFFGYSARQTGLRRAFLLKGEDVFLAAEGDTVDHRYKVVKISPTSIQVEDIPYANTQSLPLVQN